MLRQPCLPAARAARLVVCGFLTVHVRSRNPVYVCALVQELTSEDEVLIREMERRRETVPGLGSDEFECVRLVEDTMPHGWGMGLAGNGLAL